MRGVGRKKITKRLQRPLFFPRFVIRHQFGLHVAGHLLVVAELHSEEASAGSHGANLDRVGMQFGQRNLGANDLKLALRIHALDFASAAGNIAHDVAHVVFGDGHFDVINRLENDRI